MPNLELGDTRLINRIFFSAAQRRALCQLVLATYRVELTRQLSRMASQGFVEGDLEMVEELAGLIATTALAAVATPISHGAAELQSRVGAAREGGKRAEGAVLVAGLKLIDRILEHPPGAAARQPGAASLN